MLLECWREERTREWLMGNVNRICCLCELLVRVQTFSTRLPFCWGRQSLIWFIFSRGPGNEWHIRSIGRHFPWSISILPPVQAEKGIFLPRLPVFCPVKLFEMPSSAFVCGSTRLSKHVDGVIHFYLHDTFLTGKKIFIFAIVVLEQYNIDRKTVPS